MVRLAYHQIRSDPGRSALYCVGIASVFAVILVLQGFREGLDNQLRSIALERGAHLVATQAGVANMVGARSVIPQFARAQVEAVEGVRIAHPMTTLPLIYEKDGRKSAIFLVVVDSVGTPQTVVAGRRLEGDGEILVDRSLADRFDLQPGDDLSIVLFYDLIDQGGLELQRTRGDWLWKGEALLRSGQGPTFGAFTLAFEHTSWGAFGTEIDLGSLVELSYDGRENSTFNFYDEDLFGGLRLSFNDAAGTEILGAVVTDLESGTALGSVEASRRLGPQWTIEFVGRVFVSDDPQDPVHWFRRDHYLQTVVEYYL